jgi:2-dehydropantoate 2-reductase
MKNEKRLAIMGTGSLGTILGAHITQSGRKVDLIDVNREHVDALNKYGAKVIGHKEMLVPVVALTPEEMEGVYDIVFYMPKQTFNKTAFEQLRPHLDEDSIVCTLQNGIPEVEVVEAFGERRTMGAPVGWGATWVEPGVSKLTTEVQDMFFTLGTVSGEITPEVHEIKEILETMCPVEVSTNLMGLRWSKLYLNATLSGMSTVIGGTFGDVMADERSMAVALKIGMECIEVAKAAGVKMEPSHGFYFAEEMYYTDEESRQKSIRAYRAFAAPHKDLEASMLQDLKKGRKCEIDAINGVICTTGRKFNVPTPVNDRVVEIVKKIQNGEMDYKFSNVDLF